jgi:hypothetical protein
MSGDATGPGAARELDARGPASGDGSELAALIQELAGAEDSCGVSDLNDEIFLMQAELRRQLLLQHELQVLATSVIGGLAFVHE